MSDEMPFWRKIYGFRSETRWKMVVASLGYFGILLSVMCTMMIFILSEKESKAQIQASPVKTISKDRDERETIEARKNQAEKYFKEAQALHNEKLDINGALKLIEQAIVFDPNNSGYLIEKLSYLFELNQYDATIKYGKQILMEHGAIENKRKALVYSYIASASKEKGLYEEALGNCDKAVAMADSSYMKAAYLCGKGEVYYALKDYKNSLDCYKKAADTDAKMREMYVAMSDFYKIRGDVVAMLKYKRVLVYFQEASRKMNMPIEELSEEISFLEQARYQGRRYVDRDFHGFLTAFKRMAFIGGYQEFKDKFVRI